VQDVKKENVNIFRMTPDDFDGKFLGEQRKIASQYMIYKIILANARLALVKPNQVCYTKEQANEPKEAR